jgi:uncharacterized NAD-dependent epimerase/dehydratase family protein
MITAEQRLAILLQGGLTDPRGKTGLAMLRYSPHEIVAVIDSDHAGQSLAQVTGIPRSVPIVESVQAALAYRPDVLAIGIAPSGGALPDPWRQELALALNAGLSLANGLHTVLAQDPDLAPLLQSGCYIWDVRREPSTIPIASAAARTLSGKRILTVGTDMGIGKMSASLELHAAALAKGLTSEFVATGQAGILISGQGVPLDGVRVDFAAGSVEQQVLKQATRSAPELIWIEGQGSLLHPGSTATLPLLRGSQPTQLILVHRPGQTQVRNHPTIAIPPLKDVIHLYETVASAAGAFEPIRVVAIALNTHHLDEAAALQAVAQVQVETGLPCADVVRWGGDRLLDVVLAA